MNIDKVHSHTAPAVTIEKVAALVVIFGVIYALYLLQTAVGEFKRASAKLDKFDRMSRDVGKLSGKLAILDQANSRIDRMEKYMRYVPMLAKTGQDALAVSKGMDQKLEITNQRLIGANQCMVDSAAQIGTLGRSVDGMHSEMTRMASALPSIGGVQQLLAKTSSSLDKTAAGVGQVTTGIDKVGGGLDEMRSLLHSMNNQFATLQEMKPTLDKTNTTLESAFAMLQPLSESIPQLTSSMQEMNQTSRQMSDTTLEMARSIKKTPKQGALGLAILTAVQFAK